MQAGNDSPFVSLPTSEPVSADGAKGPEAEVPDDVANAFTEDAVPGAAPPPTRSVPHGSTLDESVWATLKRDLMQIGLNVRLVVFPISKQQTANKALREWDLWGPMIFSITLALLLSSSSDSPSKAFSIVFLVLTVGAAVLTFNVMLLGGKIVFFQACSLLGYCIFPLLLATALITPFSSRIIRLVGMLLGTAWASWAAVPFVSASVSPKRKALAVYPMMLMYLFLSYFALIV